ncbi:hypothetical protein METHB2_1070006 [Candidatus Methylobacter favarea]|uniref:Uncharacterized protein n=1 Tax=Candidatus Methylobacter favarea TaxID=2707345 RepID=A0A8S0W8U2_9GAMM|nr:hypothetical protein METHB2_1070006 [Candidatus Methylobacter favarea]
MAEHILDCSGVSIAVALKIALFVITSVCILIAHLTLWRMAKRPVSHETEVIRIASKIGAKFKKKKFYSET